MGKIKGWKKVLKRINAKEPPYVENWVNEDSGRLITITKTYYGYSVSTSSFVKKFDGLEKARDFAMNYMRRHQNG